MSQILCCSCVDYHIVHDEFAVDARGIRSQTIGAGADAGEVKRPVLIHARPILRPISGKLKVFVIVR